jgi:hypothetical protein
VADQNQDPAAIQQWIRESAAGFCVLLAARIAGQRPTQELLLADLRRLGIRVEFIEPTMANIESN